MRHAIDTLIALTIPFLILFHVYVAPYTKVEESFNLQATHDILTYGVPLKNIPASFKKDYDHHSFPGSVPRTFVGPLALAGVAWPFAWLVDGVERQMLVRALLGLYNAFSILAFRNGIAKTFGRDTANWYTILQSSQFHVMFYASRTISNFFAFGLTTLALRSLTLSVTGVHYQLQAQTRQLQRALVFLTVLGVVFRAELAILLGTHTIFLLYRRCLSLQEVLYPGILGLSIGLSLTIPVDSFFWQRFPLWPELTGFMYNVMQGQSVSWGTSPFHHYFSSALPRLLLNPYLYLVSIPLALIMPALRSLSRDILVPNLVFVAIYSFQPHKEWRFIVYIVPPLTAVAAMGASYIWTRRAKSMAYRVLALGLVASTLASFLASLGMLLLSSYNYSGAEALNQLHKFADGSKPAIYVHMDTLSCVSGVTRFLQISHPNSNIQSRWIYDKTEDEVQLLYPAFWQKFDYALAEKPEKAIGAWQVVRVIKGFRGVEMIRSGDTLDHDETVLRTEELIGNIDESVRKTFVSAAYRLWPKFEHFMKTWITRGWWLQVKMEPQIRILRSTRLEKEPRCHVGRSTW